MRRHEFEVCEGGSGMVCTATVMRGGGGDACGLPWDDRVHESRYDEYTVIELVDRDLGPEMPLIACLCRDCGAVVVDRAFHDRFHALHPDPFEETP